MVYLFAMLIGADRAGTATGRPPSESARAAVEMANMAALLRRACSKGSASLPGDTPMLPLAAEQRQSRPTDRADLAKLAEGAKTRKSKMVQ